MHEDKTLNKQVCDKQPKTSFVNESKVFKNEMK